MTSQIFLTNFNEYENIRYGFISDIFKLFQVDIKQILDNKFQLSIQDNEYNDFIIDSWWYWQYEYNVNLLNDKNKKDKEKQEEQESQQNNMMGNMGGYNPSKIMKQYSPSNFKSSMPRF